MFPLSPSNAAIRTKVKISKSSEEMIKGERKNK